MAGQATVKAFDDIVITVIVGTMVDGLLSLMTKCLDLWSIGSSDHRRILTQSA